MQELKAWRPKELIDLMEKNSITGKVQIAFTEQDILGKPIVHPDIKIANVTGVGQLVTDEQTKKTAGTVLIIGEKTQSALSSDSLIKLLGQYAKVNDPLVVTVSKGNDRLAAILITGVVQGKDNNEGEIIYLVTATAEKYNFIDENGHLANNYMDINE